MKKALILGFGFLSYALFLGVFLYMIAFLGDFYVPRTINAGSVDSSTPIGLAILIDLGLITLFAVQHSVMARPAFKRWLTRWVAPVLERSTYMLFSSLALILLMHQWRPIGGLLWDLKDTAAENYAWGAFAFGWVFLLCSTYMINHFDLFGLRQVFNFARNKETADLPYSERLFYKFTRHPIYVGWLLATWCVPTMSAGHLLYAAGITIYILVAIPLEERDLLDAHGARYQDYRERVPALFGRRSKAQGFDAHAPNAETNTQVISRG